MNKSIIIAVLACGVMLSSCGTSGNTNTQHNTQTNSHQSVLGSIISAATNGQTLGNTIKSILGTDKPHESDLIGTWHYRQPGVAFTTENLLAKAGGETIATEIKEKLSDTYTKVGINSQNTYLTINSDKTFSGKIDGKPISGQWTYTQEDQKLVLKTLLFSLNVYAKKTTGGMSFLMESKKLLNLFQTLAAMSGNSTLQTMGDLSKNYDGVRIGLDTHK